MLMIGLYAKERGVIRRIVSLLVVFGLLLSVFVLPQPSAKAAPSAAAAAPTLLAEVNGPGRGRVWVGAIPANSTTKPVLVFVHGLHGKATNWWGPTEYYGTNDMYDKAYASGYRTAFVSLDDEVDGPASSMWANGTTLNRQLDVILSYYGVSSVNIIAHSKGGVDTNSAIVHSGAASKVQKIVTLSSPHHGSQLADLAYSWWAGWLASLLGQRDDGTYTMQTGYMSYFRSVTDGRPEYNSVRFYTSGGSDHGPWFSAMWFGGGYLPGANDGVVTVINSNHPQQYSRLFTGSSLNHDNIRKGSNVWSLIEPTVRTTFRSSTAAQAGKTQPAAEQKAQPEEVEAASASANNLILRGGLTNSGAKNLLLPVEGGVNAITFDFLADSADLSVTFIDPSGVRYPATKSSADTGVFRGALHYSAEITAPASGAWSVETRGPDNVGYLLIASLSSPLSVTLNRGAEIVAPNAALNLSVSANTRGVASKSLAIAGTLTGTPVGNEKSSQLPTQINLNAKGQNQAIAKATAPATSGLYQIGLTVTGIAADGTSFERSIATNIPVVSAAQSATNDLQPGR
jgi:hypothetical protein